MTEKRTASRSETIRGRRTKTQDKKQKRAVEQAHRTMPPVTSRDRHGFSTTRPVRTVNRRYNAALTARRQGGLHLPVLPHLQTGPRLIPLILTLALGAAAYFLLASPTFRVTEVQVNGLSRLSAAEVNSTLGLGGRLIFFLQPEEIISRLRVSFPEIRSAQVTVALPNTVTLEVSERKPVLLWQQGDGYTWIDEDGVAFRPRGGAEGLVAVAALDTPPGSPAPMEDPLSPPAFLAPDLVRTAQTLAVSIPAGSALTYDETNGFGWQDSRGWQVYFGTGSKDAALKLQIYSSLVDSLNTRGIAPAYISVVHADAPYYRMEE